MAIIKASTQQGIAVGTPCDENRTTVFKGIPYAAPPIGELRFQPPRPPLCWQGEQVFDTWAPDCIQLNIHRPWEKGNHQPTSEDCLKLNLWTPASTTDAKLPVLVWLHGSDRLYDADGSIIADGRLCRKDILLVTPVWRCGVFGYIGLEELAQQDPNHSTGAYGILDLIAALQWVKENIAAFGGDPERITLGGHSSGAMIAKGLVTSPLTEGLFQRVILMSGGGIWDVDRAMPKEEKIRLCRECMDTAGLTVDDLKYGDAQEVSDRFSSAMSQIEFRRTSRSKQFLHPSVDNYALLEDYGKALYAGNAHDVDILCGSLWSEWKDFEFQIQGGVDGYQKEFALASALSLAVRQLQLNRKPVFHYFFEHTLPGVGGAVLHGGELQYVFGKLNAYDRPWMDYDFFIANTIMEYWANFIHTGDPSGTSASLWPAYTEDQPVSMHITDSGILTEKLSQSPKAMQVMAFVLDHPGVIEKAFFSE